MSNHRYNTPAQGTLDWHYPLNENFEKLDNDVEVRDVEANKNNYTPASGAKFFATDSGAVYIGDGSTWKLQGYVHRAGGGDLGNYVNYENGLADEEINKFILGPEEKLEVVRIALPVKGASEGTTEPDVTLTVYEGGTNDERLVSVSGNELKSETSDSSAPWVTSNSPVTVAISNASGEDVNVVPKVWVNIRR